MATGRHPPHVPALTVLDLIPTLGGKPIDEALRRRAATLEQMWRALELTPDRRGNTLRRALLDAGSGATTVVNVWGVGYRLMVADSEDAA